MYFSQTQSLSRCNAGERYLRVTFGTPKITKKQSQRGLAVVLLLTFANTDSTATATVPKTTYSLSLSAAIQLYPSCLNHHTSGCVGTSDKPAINEVTTPPETITPMGASGPPT